MRLTRAGSTKNRELSGSSLDFIKMLSEGGGIVVAGRWSLLSQRHDGIDFACMASGKNTGQHGRQE
jgi:hypothetical protein